MIQKRGIETLSISLLLIGTVFGGVVYGYNLANPTVSVNPASQVVNPGNDFCIEVHINSDGETVRTAGFQLSYPTIFTVKNFTYENLLGTNVIQIGTPSPGDNSGLINYAVARNDGGADPENGKLVTICFTAPGTPGGPYVLDLHDITLINGSGGNITGINITDGTVTVSSGAAPLMAQCNGPYSGTVGTPVLFMGSATGGTPPYSYAWDFNYDGTFNTQSTLQNPTYTYTAAGTYTVALKVTDSNITTDMCTTIATITAIPLNPTASIYPSSQSVTPGSTFCIEIHINSDGATVRSAAFQLTYPTSFTIASFTYENLLGTSVLQMGIPSPGDNSGLINYAVSRTDGGADPENGKLVTICFTAPSNPGTYTLDLHDVILVDGSGNTIPGIMITDGTVTVLPSTDYILITFEGSYNEILYQSISTNLSIECYASAFNNTYGFIDYVDAVWIISNYDGSNASINSSTGESIQLFSGWHNGNVTLEAQMSGETYYDGLNLTVDKDAYSMFIGCGWTLIGWWQDYTTDAPTLGQYITSCTVVCRFKAETQMYQTHVVGIPYNEFTITRGMGLFIYTTEASVWNGTDGTR